MVLDSSNKVNQSSMWVNDKWWNNNLSFLFIVKLNMKNSLQQRNELFNFSMIFQRNCLQNFVNDNQNMTLYASHLLNLPRKINWIQEQEENQVRD